MLSCLDLFVGLAVILSLYFLYSASEGFGQLPPGPKGLPIIGNYLQLPRDGPLWKKCNEWAEQYGDIIHVKDFHRHIFILNSFKTAYDLLEKRSSIYSGRPQYVMMHELMGFGGGTGLQQYGNTWRKHRKLYTQQLNSGAIVKFYAIQTSGSRRLLRILLDSPAKFREHFRHMAASIITDFTYGHDILPENDPLVALLDATNVAFGRALRPGAYVVDNVPVLKYLPAWFPGVGFKRYAQETKIRLHHARIVPFLNVKSQLKAGNARSCFVANSITQLGTDDESNPDVDAVKLVASATLGGTATTTVTLTIFILAMALHPEVMKKAQAELDTIVGVGRLPEFSDRQSLLYLEAIYKEVLRWFPAAPTGLPHATVAEDFYEGYRIPAGSIVIANAWRILHDAEIYPEPYKFNPERFLPNASGKMSDKHPAMTGCFGYGRRICAGKNLADATVWMAMASLLSAFNITNPRDEHGEIFELSRALIPAPGPLGLPPTFTVDIFPRSEEMETLIRSGNTF